MAEETEVIVTKFTADLTDLEKGVTEYEATLGGAAKASDSLDKSTKNLGASVGQLSPKFEAIKQSAQRTASAVAAVGTETKKAGASGGALSKLQGAFASIRTSVGNVASSANSFFGEVVKGASTAAPGLSNITGLFGGMVNPITVAAAAVVGFISNFSRLDSVQVFFDAVRIGFDTILDRFTSFEGFKGLFDPKTQAADIKFAAEQAALIDALADKEREFRVANAETNKEIAKREQQFKDITKSDEERKKIAEELTALENDNADREQSAIKARIALIQRELDQREAANIAENDISDELKDRLAQEQIALASAQASRISDAERVQRRLNSIVEQGATERAAAEQKAEAARAKAVAEAARRRQVIETNEKTLQETLDRLAQEQVDRTATEAEQEVNIVTRKYADIEAKTKEGFAKIREVTAQSGQAELSQQEAEAIKQITAARDAELAALEKKRADLAAKTREEQLEQVRQSLLSETEQKREAILVQLDLDRAAAEASIANVEERNATIAALTAKAEQDLSLIVSEEQAKRLEQEKQAQANQQALLQENAQIATDFAVASAELIGQVAAGNEDVAKNAAKVLTTLLLDTLEKIILANAFQVQAISAGAPDPANVATGGTLGITRGLILAGIVKALFAAAKSAIAGAYTGEERVGMGEAPLWQGRDGYLRRVHKNEGIVDAETNLAFLPHINAMRKGRKAYDDLIYREHIAPAIQALGYGDMSTVNEFVRSDFGNRVVTSSMLPKNYDRNIVGELRSSRREGRQQTELLAEVVKQLRPNRSRW